MYGFTVSPLLVEPLACLAFLFVACVCTIGKAVTQVCVAPFGVGHSGWGHSSGVEWLLGTLSLYRAL